MMSRPVDGTTKRIQSLFLIAGYTCALGCLVNVLVRLGWLHVGVPGFYGLSALLKWALASAVCLIVAWYLGRPERGRRN